MPGVSVLRVLLVHGNFFYPSFLMAELQLGVAAYLSTAVPSSLCSQD